MNESSQTDIYGGCCAIAFEGTGFFRLEHADRWWLVTPLGHAFLSFGINHVGADVLQRDYNRAHWMEQFEMPEAGGRDFHGAFEEKVGRDLALFGMNTLGCHSATQHNQHLAVPYVQQLRFVNNCHWMTPTAADFPDVFSEAFVAHCDARARAVAEAKARDPYLLGYSMTDCPIFTEKDAAKRPDVIYGKARQATPTWPRVLANLGPGHPGKKQYITYMRKRYQNDIHLFNQTYQATFDSFQTLLKTSNWRAYTKSANSQEAADDECFLVDIVERYYQLTTEAIQRYDPHHLIFGDKLNGNTGVPDEIVKLAGQYMDLIFYQFYGYYDEQEPTLENWSNLTQKALFNGDSCYSTPNEHMPNPFGPHCASQEKRAEAFSDFALRAFHRKDFVGWHWCGWMDSWEVYQKRMQHSGLQDPLGNIYAPMQTAMRAFSEKMYQ